MNKKIVLVSGILLSFIMILVACKKDEASAESTAEYDSTPYTLKYINNTLPIPNLPADNPLTQSKVDLGRMLFFEKEMSLDGTISCGSCHTQTDGFSDANTFSEGVGGSLGTRQAMAIVNLAWHDSGFFWDGRSATLREQSLKPIEDALEMKETLANVVLKLQQKQEYKDQFMRAFGSEEITSEKMGLALENFMFSVVSDDSKFDRFLIGQALLSDSEERGRVLFFGEYNEFFPATSGADCAHCHAGNNFENNEFANNGMDTDAEFVDMGREDVTNDPADRAKFKVPTLRNIEMTSPYMHDGRFTTLEEVVDHYNNNIENSSTVDGALLGTTSTGLMLDAQEKQDLINFLKTLTDQRYLENPEYHDPN